MMTKPLVRQHPHPPKPGDPCFQDSQDPYEL